MKRAFTGRDMAAVLVAGFGVVIGVNLLMATLAVSGFSGVVVKNSYVASQRFNGWLDQAERQRALGWSARAERLEGGRIAIVTGALPAGARVSAMLRRPLGKPDTRQLVFKEVAPGRFESSVSVDPGRWIIRVRIAASGADWATEGPLP